MTAANPTRAALAALATAAAALGAACAPPPANPTPTTKPAVQQPIPTTTTSTTTTAPLADPVPGFVRSHIAPLPSYTVTYSDLPSDVLAALTAATSEASELSGITLTVAPNPSDGPAPSLGEIRVRMGNLCGVAHEAGCAVVYGTDRQITGSDMSVSPEAVGHPRLTSVVLHELGHALGLLHVDSTGFAPQIMGNNGEPLTRYQGGDRAGLAAAGSAARASAAAAGVASTEPVTVIGRYELTDGDDHDEGCNCC